MFSRRLTNPKFKERYDFIERSKEANRVLDKYPDRIPIICEKNLNRSNESMPEIDKNKYLVPSDLTCGQFIYTIRKRLQMPAEKAIFLLVRGVIPPIGTQMLELYEKYKDDDNFLYINYTSENVFGGL